MRRAVAGIWGSPAAEGTSALVVTAVFFTLGGLFGCLMAFRAQGGGGDALTAYLDQFLASAREGALVLPALPGLIWRSVRWPLAVFLFGFTALGLIGIPALSALRGFFLAFSPLLPAPMAGWALRLLFCYWVLPAFWPCRSFFYWRPRAFTPPGAWPAVEKDREGVRCPIIATISFVPVFAPGRQVCVSSWSVIWSPSLCRGPLVC